MEKEELLFLNESDRQKLKEAYEIIKNVRAGITVDYEEFSAINTTMEYLDNAIYYKRKYFPHLIDDKKSLETLIRESIESYHNGRRAEHISRFRVNSILSPDFSTIIVNVIDKDGKKIVWGTGIPLEILTKIPRYQKEFNELVKRGYIKF